MQLNHVDITRSPTAPDRVRLCGEVTYDDGAVRTETYWFDVPEHCADSLSASGNPWLAALIPLAVTIGEPLRLCQPIDSVLLANVQELMRIWKCWYPHLNVVPIEAEVVAGRKPAAPLGTAAFFSGGVDSFFTALRHGGQSDSRIDDLLAVWGFDVPLANEDAFRRIRDQLKRAAADLGKDLIDVATNLRVTRWDQADWGFLAHGCGLASVGLALEKRYSKLLIASAGGYRDLLPWGSHVMTDPLLSTSQTEIVHDGAEFDRVEKTAFVVKSDVGLRSLRVCWKSTDGGNCCACNKCYRTMLTLELFGALDRSGNFGQKKLDLAAVTRIYSEFYYDVDCYREIQALALRTGRADIAEAIEQGLKKSARLKKWLGRLRSVKTPRLARRVAGRLERELLASHIR